MTIISTTVGKNALEEMNSPIVNKKSPNSVLGCNLKNDRMLLARFQGKPFNITVIQVHAPTTDVNEAEVDHFYEDRHDLELTPKKDVFFIIKDWNAKEGSQDIPGVTGRFGGSEAYLMALTVKNLPAMQETWV